MSFYKSSTRKSRVACGGKAVATGKAMISALLLFLGFVAQANAVCYVNGAATGKNDGSSWTDAYTNPQFALLQPDVCLEIWVAKGVYKPTLGSDPTDHFEINAGVTMYGGFEGNEVVRDARVPGVNLTVLSGDIDNDDANAGGNQVDATTADIHGTNSYHVVFVQGTSIAPVTGSTVLDGFTITGGDASDLVTPIASGGGLYCNGSRSGNECSPTLRNLIFSGNAAARSGGGMYNNGSSGGVSSPILIDITFTGNRAATSGGAIYDDANDGESSPSLTNVFFSANSASLGGAMYSLATGGGANKALSGPTLTSVAFVGNSAEVGGAMYNGSLTGGISNPKLSVVTFSGNSTTNDSSAFGGGMYNPCEGTDSINDPTLTNVTFSGNSSHLGGAMYNASIAGGTSQPRLFNVTFSGNNAEIGGAIYDSEQSAGVVDAKLINVILWGDSASAGTSEVKHDATFPLAISSSVVEGGCPDASVCTNLLATDPKLGPLAENGGFTRTLLPGFGSSAIDTGSDGNCPAMDQRGLSRPQGPHCEIGAVEVQVLPPPEAEPLSITIPMNTSKVVTFVGIDVNPGGPFTFGVTPPMHGSVTVSITGDTATYLPNRRYVGSDSFTYTATDANGTSLPATVSITVTGVLPVAQPLSFTTPENVSKAITLMGSDANAGGPFIYTFLAAPPIHGSVTLSLSGDVATYLPNKDYVGPDSYTYTVSDENGTSLPATVTIVVTSIVPVAEPRSIVVPHNTSKQITFAATDSNAGGPFAYTFTPVSSPAHGKLGKTLGDVVTYTPTHDYAGPDTFDYTATDVNGTSIPATVTITVLPVGGGPTPSGTTAIPTLGTWGLLTLAGLIGVTSIGRKQKN